MKLIAKNDLDVQSRLAEIESKKSNILAEANALGLTSEESAQVQEFELYLDEYVGDKHNSKEFYDYFMTGIKKLSPTQQKFYDLLMEYKRVDGRKSFILYEENEHCSVTDECPNKLIAIISGGKPPYLAYCGDHKPN